MKRNTKNQAQNIKKRKGNTLCKGSIAQGGGFMSKEIP